MQEFNKKLRPSLKCILGFHGNGIYNCKLITRGVELRLRIKYRQAEKGSGGYFFKLR